MPEKTLLFVASVFLFLSHPAKAGLFDYTVLYPKGERPCEENASSLGKRLEKNYGVKIHGVRCEDAYYYDKIIIQYTSLESLFHQKETDRYDNLEACSRDLERRKLNFIQATKLQPFLAFCALPRRPYSKFATPDITADLYLDGFGEVKIFPHRFEYELEGVPVGDIKKIEKEIEQRLKPFDLAISQIHFLKAKTSNHLLSINYFSKWENGFSPVYSPSFTYQTAERCHQEAEALSQGFREYPSFLSSFCLLRAFYGNFRLEALFMPLSYEIQETQERYNRFEDCQADRQRIADFYKKEVNKNAMTAICSGPSYEKQPYQYFMHVFAKRQ